jgi:lipoprotein-releasing system permease protein
MPFTWFVAFRYLRSGKGQTALMFAAVSVGVAVVVFLSALIGGLQASLVAQTLGSAPHLTLKAPREEPRRLVQASPVLMIARTIQSMPQRLRSVVGWPSIVSMVELMSGVVAVSPVVAGGGFAIRGDAREPVFIQGVDIERFLSIIDVRKKMVEGRFDGVGGEVAMGTGLAKTLNVTIGDKFLVSIGEGNLDVVRVAGIFALGNQVADTSWVLTSLRHAQSLFDLPGGATRIDIKVAAIFAADRIATDLADRTGLDAESWMTANSELLAGLSAQGDSKIIIQFFVIVAVALGIASVLAVSVVQKAREIGILRALGTPASRVLTVFLIQGGVVGFVGSVVGSLFGVLLAKTFEGMVLAVDGTPRFPVAIGPTLMIGAIALATGVGVVSAALPARRASRIDPMIAIRNG